MEKMLEEIGEIVLGHTFREAIENTPDGNYCILQAKNIRGEGAVETKGLVRTFLEGTKTKALVRTEDVILSNRGTFRAGVFKGGGQNILAASSVYIIRIHDHQICLPDYVAIFLNSQEGQNLLESMNRGTLIKSLPKKSLSGLRMPVPPVSKQKAAIDIHKNFHTRLGLYERKSLIEKNVAYKAISALISQ